MILGVDFILWEKPLQDVKSIVNKQVKKIDGFMKHDSLFKIFSRLTSDISKLLLKGSQKLK